MSNNSNVRPADMERITTAELAERFIDLTHKPTGTIEWE